MEVTPFFRLPHSVNHEIPTKSRLRIFTRVPESPIIHMVEHKDITNNEIRPIAI